MKKLSKLIKKYKINTLVLSEEIKKMDQNDKTPLVPKLTHYFSKNETNIMELHGENIQNRNRYYVHNGEYPGPILTFFVEFDTISI